MSRNRRLTRACSLKLALLTISGGVPRTVLISNLRASLRAIQKTNSEPTRNKSNRSAAGEREGTTTGSVAVETPWAQGSPRLGSDRHAVARIALPTVLPPRRPAQRFDRCRVHPRGRHVHRPALPEMRRPASVFASNRTATWRRRGILLSRSVRQIPGPDRSRRPRREQRGQLVRHRYPHIRSDRSAF